MTVIDRWVTGKSLTLRHLPELDDSGDFTGFYSSTGSSSTNKETLEHSFSRYVEGIYKRNGIIWACIAARMLPFSEVRFQLQQEVEGRYGKLVDHPSLRVLDRPGPNQTTGEMLSRMEQDVSLAGNWYGTIIGPTDNQRIRRLRPDWVWIVSGVRGDPNATDPNLIESEPLAYIYHPPGSQPTLLTADQVAHYSIYPDPICHWRGMSWMTPLMREIKADDYATKHKMKWFENGAALSTIIKYPEGLEPAKFQRYVELFKEKHRGADKAYETLHIGGGADAVTVGSELKTDFRAIQGAGETRVAAAAGVGAVIARFSEGLAGSSLNQGNYAAAKRQFADMLIRPMWRSASGCLEKFVTVPENHRLWTDDRDVEFLKEDRKDAAEILDTTARTIKSFVDAGFTPDSTVTAVETGDLGLLEHSGLYSVQLQAAGSNQPNPGAQP